MKNSNQHARDRLDSRFNQMRTLLGEPRPHKGWVRAIRDALGMSANELAERVGVSQQRIAAIERDEVQDAVTLKTLREVADGLECDLVYVLLPRTSLEPMVRQQAQRKATALLAPVTHHSRLEAQSLSASEDQAQIDELANRLADRRGLWSNKTADS